jgi:uncharacterized protein YecT (DUF1311 family)
MKKICYLTVLSFLVSMNCIGQTQMEMNQQAGDQDKRADKRLTAVYRQILKTYSSDTLFTKNLKAAQKAWLRYRDYQIHARFPHYPGAYYGSMLSMCVSEYAMKLTEDRIGELEEWLIGEEEGGCSSSVRNKDKLTPYQPSQFE